jgi:diadenosine tetraphosphate (Ap4A) HIT family hydrolase
MNFTLHPRLAADSFFVRDLPLCRVLFMNNALFPWLILVPRIADVVELTDLADEDYTTAMAEIRQMAKILQQITQPTKLNIAALGNQVRQLHIHLIARFEGDAAWPNPVWNGVSSPYTPDAAEKWVQRLAQATL